MGMVKQMLAAAAAIAALGFQDAAAAGFSADGIVYDQSGQVRLYVHSSGAIVYDERGEARLYLAPEEKPAAVAPTVAEAVAPALEASALTAKPAAVPRCCR